MSFNKTVKNKALCVLLALMLVSFAAVAVFGVDRSANAEVGDVFETVVFRTGENTSIDVIDGSGWKFYTQDTDINGSKKFTLNKDLVNKFIEAGYTSFDIWFNGGNAFGERDFENPTYYNSSQPLFAYITVNGTGSGGTVQLAYGQMADYHLPENQTPMTISLTDKNVDYKNNEISFIASNNNNFPDYNGQLTQECFVSSIVFKGAGKADYTLSQDSITKSDYIISEKSTSTVTYLPDRGWRIDSTDGCGFAIGSSEAYNDQSRGKSFSISKELVASYYSKGYTNLSVAFCEDGIRFGYDPAYVSPHTANLFICQAFSGDGKMYIKDIFVNQGYGLPLGDINLGYGSNRVLDINLEGLVGLTIRVNITNAYPGTDSYSSDGIMSAFISYLKFSGAGKDDVYLGGPKDMGDGIFTAGANTEISYNNGSYKIQSDQESATDYGKRKIVYINKEIIAAYKEAGATQLVLGFDDGRKYGLEEGEDHFSIHTLAKTGDKILLETKSLAESGWTELGGIDVMKVVIDLNKSGVNYDHNLVLSFSNKFSYESQNLNKEVYISYIGFSDGETSKQVKINTINCLADQKARTFKAEMDYGYYRMAVEQFGEENVKVGIMVIPKAQIGEDTQFTHEYLNENGIDFYDLKATLDNADTALADGVFKFSVSLTGIVNKDNLDFEAAAYICVNESLFFNEYIYSERESLSVTIVNYNVVYNLDGGNNSALNPSKWNFFDEPALAAAEKEFYDFDGWYSDAQFGGEKILSLSEDLVNGDSITLYAKFIKKVYTIKFFTDGGTVINSISKQWGESVTAPSNPTKEFYEFVGWTLNGQPYEFTVMPKENIELTAEYRGQEYLITKGENSEGVTFEVAEKGRYKEIVTLTVNLTNGYSVSDIIIESEDGSSALWFKDGENYSFEMPHSNVKVTVTAQEKKYTITYNNVEGIINDNPIEIGALETVTLKDAEKEGYVFEGWYKDPQFKEKVTSLSGVSGDVVLYAKFTEKSGCSAGLNYSGYVSALLIASAVLFIVLKKRKNIN